MDEFLFFGKWLVGDLKSKLGSFLGNNVVGQTKMGRNWTNRNYFRYF
ncbi:MAG: hypothetical protein ACI9XO_005043 [Paraglaciecola sp.]|jgi:hypothetical protein